MSNSLDKEGYLEHENLSLPSSAAIGNNKPVDKADDDQRPLLELTPKSTNKINLNIWDAPIISGFVSFKEILGENLVKALYVLLMLTMTFMLAQVNTR